MQTMLVRFVIFLACVGPAFGEGEWLQVTADPARLEAARALARETASAEASRLASDPAAFQYEAADDLRRIAAADPSVVVKLKSRALDETRPAGERVPAAQVLGRIGDASGVDSLLDILRSKADDDRIAVLHALDPWHIDPALATLRKDAIHAALKALPQVLSAEAKRLKILRYSTWKVPGVESEIRSLWKPGVPADLRAVLSRALPPEAKTREGLAVLAAALGAPELDLAASGEIFEEATEFLDSTDPAVRQECATLFEEKFPWDAVARLGHVSTPWMTIFERLARRATPELKKVLEKLLASSLHHFYKQYGLEGLARLLGKEIRSRCPLDPRDPGSLESSLHALGIAFRGTSDESLIRDITAMATQVENSAGRGQIARCAWRVGGDVARKFVGSIVPSLPADVRASYLAWSRGESPLTLITKFAAQGLGQAPATPPVEPASEEEPPDALFAVLGSLGILAHFDTETDAVPVDHDTLIRMLAEASGGAFQPEAVHQSVLGGGDEGEPYQYQVQFILGGKLYRFEPEYRGDWYDVARTMEAVEKALAGAGIAGRFHALDTGGQDAAYVFGPPERIMAAAAEYLWPMTATAGDPEARGRAAEDAVRQSLENRK